MSRNIFVKLALIGAAVTATLAMPSLASATTLPATTTVSAQAAVPSSTKVYGPIDLNKECVRTGSTYANISEGVGRPNLPLNPYEIKCVKTSLSYTFGDKAPTVGIEDAGGMNLNAACEDQYPTWKGYPRTVATVTYEGLRYKWVCQTA